MDDKTEQLRDIFLDVTEESTVTEPQDQSRGSLATTADVETRLAGVVATMRDQLGFGTTLDDEDLATVVRLFYAREPDAAIARALGDESLAKTVSRSRVELHLLRDADLDAPMDLDALRDFLDHGLSTREVADRFDVSPSTVRRYRRVVEAQDEIRRVNDRYRSEFESILQDRELSERMTDAVQEDGLEEATEGQETNVSF